MRWQKTARLAIAAFVVVFAAVVFVTLRRTPPKQAESSLRTDRDAISETHAKPGLPLPEIKRWKPDGTTALGIAYESQRTYADGRTVFEKSTITLPDRNGRTVRIIAGEAEVIVPQKTATPVSTVKVSRGAKLLTGDGLEVTSDTATYDQSSGMTTIPGHVQFRNERMTGSGVGATYDEKANVLWLLEQAKVTVTPDEKGAGALEATAGSAGFARADHSIRLTKTGHIANDGRTLDADDITIQLTADDRLIQNASLRGNSRIAGTPGGGGAEGMAARDIDLTYAADGRTLQSAKLIENASINLAGAPGTAARKVSARLIDVAMGPDGSTVTGLNAAEKVEVEIPADGGAPARRISAAALNGGGASGLQTATFTGGVTFRELRPGGQGAEAGERIGLSQRLIVETQPGLGAIQQADFRGNVHIVDGATTADGQRALYHVSQDKFDVMPSAGDPGPPPSVNDGRVLVHADAISLTIGSKKLTADKNVRSSLLPSKPEAAKGRGKEGNATQQGKLPSMLKQDEVVHVVANHLEYDGAVEKATYTGAARLWQDKTTIRGETIVVDDKAGNLTANGKVMTVMFFEEVDADTKIKRLAQTDASGDAMVYEEAKRLATYTTGPTGMAHIVGSQGDVTADRIQLFLKKEANELERAEADGQVVVKEGFRIAKGTHLTYTTEDDTYRMDGSPVEVEERKPTECLITTAAKLVFKRGSEHTVVTGDGLNQVQSKPCPPK
jgi:lipopolysaccharide export system protein LptA